MQCPIPVGLAGVSVLLYPFPQKWKTPLSDKNVQKAIERPTWTKKVRGSSCSKNECVPFRTKPSVRIPDSSDILEVSKTSNTISKGLLLKNERKGSVHDGVPYQPQRQERSVEAWENGQNTAVWSEKHQRWQINVQKDGKAAEFLQFHARARRPAGS